MRSERGSVVVKVNLYKDSKARMPILRTVTDVLLLTTIITFICCNGYIPADKAVLFVLDVFFGIQGVLLLFCLQDNVSNFMKMKKFYAEADVQNEYEFFSNAVGMYQYRSGKIAGCEILYYTQMAKKWETKTRICFTNNQFDFYYLPKSEVDAADLNDIRAALGLPFTGEKPELKKAELSIAPFTALVKEEEKKTETPLTETEE